MRCSLPASMNGEETFKGVWSPLYARLGRLEAGEVAGPGVAWNLDQFTDPSADSKPLSPDLPGPSEPAAATPPSPDDTM